MAARAEATGLRTHWGRKVLEVRPPVRIDKGAGIVSLLEDADVDVAMYIGDDTTDLDAFRGLIELVRRHELERAVRVAVRSDEGPAELTEEADFIVEGPEGVRQLLSELVGR